MDVIEDSGHQRSSYHITPVTTVLPLNLLDEKKVSAVKGASSRLAVRRLARCWWTHFETVTHNDLNLLSDKEAVYRALTR